MMKPSLLSPMSFIVSCHSPSRLLIAPFIPLLCFSSIPWNLPPSPVAEAKASATMSTLIFPSVISCFSTLILLPVFSDITTSGLNPALIICNRSCPISLPVELICAKASVRELNFWESPIEISPIWRRIGITFSASILKPNKVCAPFARSFIISGVLAAYSLISPNSLSPLVLPAKVSKDIWRLSISPRTSIIFLTNSALWSTANSPPIVLRIPRSRLSSTSASPPTSCIPCLRLPFIKNSISTAFIFYFEVLS